VIRDDAHEIMYCYCMKLESMSFPCEPMFAAMKYTNMKKIPSGCILRQWTIGAKEQIELNEDNIAHEEDDVGDGNRRIRDPQVVISKRVPKGKKFRTCTKCRAVGHTRRTCPKNANCKSAEKEPLDDFDLNEVYSTSPQYSPTNSPEDIIGENNSVLVREKLMSLCRW